MPSFALIVPTVWDRRSDTEADFDRSEIGDDLTIADRVCSQGYCVDSSDVDLFGNLNRVIDRLRRLAQLGPHRPSAEAPT